MANAVLFIGWDRPHVGTEEKVYGWLLTEGMEFFKKNQGKYFERFEMVALTPHGGNMNGCIVLFGDRAKMDEMRRTDEFEAFAMRMNMQCNRFGVVPGVTYEGMQAVMKRIPKR